MTISNAKFLIHEMTNKLTSVLGFLELGDLSTEDTKKLAFYKKALPEAKACSDILKDLSEILVELARTQEEIAAHNLALAQERVSVAATLANKVADMNANLTEQIAEAHADIEAKKKKSDFQPTIHEVKKKNGKKK